MGIGVKEIMEMLESRINDKDWHNYDNGYEFTSILDFGSLRKELENSIVLNDYLNAHNIDMVFDNIGTHFVKL